MALSNLSLNFLSSLSGQVSSTNGAQTVPRSSGAAANARGAAPDTLQRTGQPPYDMCHAGAPRHHGPPPLLDDAADALELTPEELAEQLEQGETLESVAASQGVSLDSLKEALVADLQTRRPGLSSEDAAAVVDRVVAGAPKAHRGRGGHHPPPLESIVDGSEAFRAVQMRSIKG